ncbi:MAG: ribonuclease Y [Eubacteriaceae bacterium]|nr:ribonuclease Y [Eubacteriaceae bacterium]
MPFVFYFLVCIGGIGVGFYAAQLVNKKKIENARFTASNIIEEAMHDGENAKKQMIIEAKDEIFNSRKELDKEIRERRNEISQLEKRALQREETIDKKTEAIEKRDDISQRKAKEIDVKEEKIAKFYQQKVSELEKISKLSFEEARQILLEEVEKQISRETALLIKNKESEAREEADKNAKEVIAYAIQRCAADHVSESTVTVVNLPSDEMKGRIIGREGRNIRTIETLTGVDLIIDDTPEAVILSGFDPVRREVARIALERLIVDGRIHPARIEEMIHKAESEIDAKIKMVGEQAIFEVNVLKMHPELIKLVGRLNYRTSYGQNVLKHSIEVAQLAGIMADELGLNSRIARRAGILHDIGKGIDHEVEGPHVQIAVDMLRKYKESNEVIHAIEAHHNDIEARTLEAVLIQAADAISAARPGARREALESYTKRLEKLEGIVNSFEGVEKCYAIQAGREVRIMVKPNEIDDLQLVHIARNIAKQIENNLDYPGQIKVNMIRETRAVEYAK